MFNMRYGLFRCIRTDLELELDSYFSYIFEVIQMLSPFQY